MWGKEEPPARYNIVQFRSQMCIRHPCGPAVLPGCYLPDSSSESLFHSQTQQRAVLLLEQDNTVQGGSRERLVNIRTSIYRVRPQVVFPSSVSSHMATEGEQGMSRIVLVLQCSLPMAASSFQRFVEF